MGESRNGAVMGRGGERERDSAREGGRERKNQKKLSSGWGETEYYVGQWLHGSGN